jgi:tetraacyldisaccharide 4'-kinase
MNRLQLHWTRRTLTSTLLLPLAWLFSFLVFLRRLAYRRGWLHAIHVGVPVIVVGNITAGGSGKTPLVIWLANALRARGLRPGVVSRGYGGSASGCVDVDRRSDPREVGDEPLLIHYKTGVPVVVGRDRVAAARTLLALHPGIDVILSDDGLQHYRCSGMSNSPCSTPPPAWGTPERCRPDRCASHPAVSPRSMP